KFGTATSMIVQGSPVRQAFLRFMVRGVPANGVAQARVRLTVGSGSSDGSVVGGTLRAISNNVWTETATSYATRPALDGRVLANVGAVKPNQVVDFDVTSAVRADGTYNFALTSTSTDSVCYRSREASTGRPQLVITTGTTTI